MTGRDVIDLMTAREKHATGIKITVNKEQVDNEYIGRLSQVLTPFNQGTCPLNINYITPEAQVDLTLGVQWRVTPSDDLLHNLKPLAQDVELQFS
jgi:DNA polymerase-3 subunit alpha